MPFVRILMIVGGYPRHVQSNPRIYSQKRIQRDNETKEDRAKEMGKKAIYSNFISIQNAEIVSSAVIDQFMYLFFCFSYHYIQSSQDKMVIRISIQFIAIVCDCIQSVRTESNDKMKQIRKRKPRDGHIRIMNSTKTRSLC